MIPTDLVSDIKYQTAQEHIQSRDVTADIDQLAQDLQSQFIWSLIFRKDPVVLKKI